MKQFFLLNILIACCINSFSQVPVISSFAPVSGPIGATVTITGNNFSTVPANNIVYMGAARALVTAASATSITAIVPVGASFQPLTVTVNNLVAFSAQPFLTTFGNGAVFSENDFSSPVTVAAARTPCFGDFDNDGIIDMATIINGNKISIYKNNSTPGISSFAAGTPYATTTDPTQISTGDFDGDGKLDIVVIGSSSGTVALYKNSSTPGNIFFDAYTNYTFSATGCHSIDVADIDADGKPDLIATYTSSGSAFSVARNTSTAGNISFAFRINVSFGIVPGGSGTVGSKTKVFAKDIDGDGKPDVTCLSQYFPPILIYRNTSTPGIIRFAANVSITTGRTNSTGLGFFDLGDLDGDQMPDMALAIVDSAQICTFRNTSTVGNISFAPRTILTGNYVQNNIAICDIDGDAKPEILVTAYDSLIIHKNNSSPGNIIINTKQRYSTTGSGPIIVADVDEDGKGDLVLSETLKVLVYKNLIYGPVIKSVIPITAQEGEAVTIKGTRFTAVNSVRFGGIEAASYTIVSDSVLIAIVGNGSSGNVTVAAAEGNDKFDGFTFSLPIPVIDSFAPTAGPVGSTVVIKGKKFSPVLSDNLVYFGSGKATVTAATDSSLTVTVPAYTSYLPISVTIASRNLTAWSSIPFNTTFDAYITAFSNANFGDTVNYATPSKPVTIVTDDFDADGKPDIAASIYYDYSGVSVFKNTSVANGKPSFANRKDFATYGAAPGGNATGVTETVSTDVDGDGKPDMATVSNGSYTLSIFKNNSNADSISFKEKINFLAGLNPTSVSTADLDNDGKPDFAIANPYPTGRISVLKNISTTDSMMMKPIVEFICGSVPQHILLEDFDNDGKRDMACTNYNESNIALFRNNSTKGTISFEPKTNKATIATPYYMAAADLDGDGKIEILVTNISAKTFSVFKNMSTPGTILFADKTDFTLVSGAGGITIADMDGDGKPDILLGNSNYPACISLFKNSSVPGSIVLAARVDISKTYTPNNIFATDVNGDGKPDIISAHSGFDKITTLRNTIGDPANNTTCPFADSTVFLTNIPATAYQWQVNTGSGFVNIADGSNYSGATTARLVLINAPSTWYGYQFRCVTDIRNSSIQVLKMLATWKGTVSSSWENPANWSCGQLPDSNTDVVISLGTIIVASNINVRSLKVSAAARLTINSGYNITVSQ